MMMMNMKHSEGGEVMTSDDNDLMKRRVEEREKKYFALARAATKV